MSGIQTSSQKVMWERTTIASQQHDRAVRTGRGRQVLTHFQLAECPGVPLCHGSFEKSHEVGAAAAPNRIKAPALAGKPPGLSARHLYLYPAIRMTHVKPAFERGVRNNANGFVFIFLNANLRRSKS
ncbi:hypothetical protein [Rhizobium sp. Leaf386]|uniref:hypothetical protein n=1 Tax=Rhizobium sp. Leaf386 TaxID=1736359 RepID=UPI0012E2B763|nr:hypothetical protein [Rhizobium sp. Leaf386]